MVSRVAFVPWTFVGCDELRVVRRLPFVALCCVLPERPVRRILDRIPPLIPESVVFPEVLYFPLIPERPSLLRDLSQFTLHSAYLQSWTAFAARPLVNRS